MPRGYTPKSEPPAKDRHFISITPLHLYFSFAYHESAFFLVRADAFPNSLFLET